MSGAKACLQVMNRYIALFFERKLVISALPGGENFLKEGLNQGILVRSEQIVKGLG